MDGSAPVAAHGAENAHSERTAAPEGPLVQASLFHALPQELLELVLMVFFSLCLLSYECFAAHFLVRMGVHTAHYFRILGALSYVLLSAHQSVLV